MNEPLWNFGGTKQNLSDLFKKRAVLAGYPKGMLSFHSLRAGKYLQTLKINLITNLHVRIFMFSDHENDQTFESNGKCIGYDFFCC